VRSDGVRGRSYGATVVREQVLETGTQLPVKLQKILVRSDGGSRSSSRNLSGFENFVQIQVIGSNLC